MLLAVGEHLFGQVPGPVLRAANGFRGGVGSSRQEMCGALSGGVMALGLIHGRESVEQDDRAAVEPVRRWREAFLAHFRYTQCEPIYRLVHEPGAPGTCAVVAGEAARLLVELIEQEPDQ
ncbi:MAG: C-GCAxxG-C-C family protein [Anaerolineae bacterium]